MAKLSKIEKELIKEGNTYTFAKALKKHYSEEVEKDELDIDHRLIDFEDGIYRVDGRDGKFFFDDDFNFVGFKEW